MLALVTEEWIPKTYRTLKNRKNKKLLRFDKHESHGYAISDRCSRNKANKIKILVEGNRYWNSDNSVADNCHPRHCSNSPKGSWDLRKFVVTGPQEHKSTVKAVLHNQIMMKIIIIIIIIIIINYNIDNYPQDQEILG